MLNRFNLMLLLSAPVLILGLSSCQRATQSGVQAVPDPWNPPSPILQLAGVPHSLRSQNGNNDVILADQITFTGNQSQRITSILVDTQCAQKGQKPAQLHQQFKNQRTLTIQDLMPNTVLANFHSNPLWRCNLKLTLLDSIGSTRTRWIRNLRVLANPVSRPLSIYIDNKQIKFANKPLAVKESNLDDSIRWAKISKQAGSLSLVCQDFSITTQGHFDQMRLDQLAQEPLQQKVDPREADTQQLCRLLERNSDGITRISPKFQVQFQNPKVDYKFTILPLNDYHQLHHFTLRIFKLQFSNPHPFPITIALPADPGNSFAFQLITTFSYYQFGYSHPFIYPIRYQFTNGSTLPEFNGQYFVTLQPYSKTAVIGYVVAETAYHRLAGFQLCPAWGIRYEFRQGIAFEFYQAARAVNTGQWSSAIFTGSTVFFNPARTLSVGLLPFAAPLPGASDFSLARSVKLINSNNSHCPN